MTGQIDNLRVLGLIPARGGSKGVARKNARTLCGKPLLQYTAEAALGSHQLSRVLLSTDDQEIAEIGRACGLAVPFIRPDELARDDTPMLPVVQHALGWAEQQGDYFDAVCLLQPTNPTRRSELIDACIELFDERSADSVMTVIPLPQEHNPYWSYVQDELGLLQLATGGFEPIRRRQDLPPAFIRDGSVYVTRRDVLMERNSLYGTRVIGYELDAEQSVNIDNLDDWARAETMLSANNDRAQAFKHRA
jgi:CMP-N-acetylneuraminic acid synthetase